MIGCGNILEAKKQVTEKFYPINTPDYRKRKTVLLVPRHGMLENITVRAPLQPHGKEELGEGQKCLSWNDLLLHFVRRLKCGCVGVVCVCAYVEKGALGGF